MCLSLVCEKIKPVRPPKRKQTGTPPSGSWGTGLNVRGIRSLRPALPPRGHLLLIRPRLAEDAAEKFRVPALLEHQRAIAHGCRELETGASEAIDRKLVPHLEQLHALYKVLRQAREERGAIDFETVETTSG